MTSHIVMICLNHLRISIAYRWDSSIHNQFPSSSRDWLKPTMAFRFLWMKVLWLILRISFNPFNLAWNAPTRSCTWISSMGFSHVNFWSILHSKFKIFYGYVQNKELKKCAKFESITLISNFKIMEYWKSHTWDSSTRMRWWIWSLVACCTESISFFFSNSSDPGQRAPVGALWSWSGLFENVNRFFWNFSQIM